MFTLLLSKMLLIEAKKKINVSVLINSRGSKLLLCSVFALLTRTCAEVFLPPASSLTVGICSVVSSVSMLLSAL